MQRTNIYLTDEQHASLDRLAAELGQTKAAVIRDLVDEGVARRSVVAFRQLLAETAGAWGDDVPQPERGVDARQAYLDELDGP